MTGSFAMNSLMMSDRDPILIEFKRSSLVVGIGFSALAVVLRAFSRVLIVGLQFPAVL